MNSLLRAVRSERGDILLTAIIMTLLLCFICAMSLKVSLGRAVIVEKSLTNQESAFLGQQALSVVNGCLQNISAGNQNVECTVAFLDTCDANTQFPLTVTTRGHTRCVILSAANWVNSSCQVQIQVYEPAGNSCP